MHSNQENLTRRHFLKRSTQTAAAAGFSMVMILFAAVRERVAAADVPEVFRGPAIALVTAGLMSLAFMGFSGLIKG